VQGPDNRTNDKEECCCSHVMRLNQLGDGNLFSRSAHTRSGRADLDGRNKTLTRLGYNSRARVLSRQ
jgi:hypothetical protein